ncbi:6-phosphogluconolactonase [Bradyrhizobium sp. CCBAU 51753]|uniref:6-phosphogluconolactonase n=1 Tax=Bradyrhizobium sp. CCBAU 51753 TaxID=1325100 RepID=UPI00188A1807|nr:6-phosphogluconolactonase [Bradyrhizobium sp. CCBAU 51753]QOZ27721.1 6-phosphogluconolactonase [Bradyrhizobium sp. CCBAU 51753]
MATSHQRKIIPVADPAALAKAAAERVIARIEQNPGRVAVCLTGGSSPKALYQLLATREYRDAIPWDRVDWFIGDERLVPRKDPLHNMCMARQAFLDRCAPAANVHPIATDTADLNDPDVSAALYENELMAFYGAEQLDPARPLFDLVLMGVGPDGHTASLFPGYPAVAESARWVVGVPKANVEPFVPRVTLTLPTLASCREMLFEIAGESKRAILARLLAGEDLPANRARSQHETAWLVDQAALPEDFRG